MPTIKVYIYLLTTGSRLTHARLACHSLPNLSRSFLAVVDNWDEAAAFQEKIAMRTIAVELTTYPDRAFIGRVNVT